MSKYNADLCSVDFCVVDLSVLMGMFVGMYLRRKQGSVVHSNLEKYNLALSFTQSL